MRSRVSQPKGRKTNSMGFLLIAIPLALLSLLLCSCDDLPGSREPATPTPGILADTFFHGCAYLDSNSNGTPGPDAQAVGGAQFVVTLREGAGFGAFTGASGCATVVVPGGLSEESWPVTVSMEPPEEAGYLSVSPAKVVLEYPDTRADFLFAEP
jgi:hypothetical protein